MSLRVGIASGIPMFVVGGRLCCQLREELNVCYRLTDVAGA